MKAFRHWSKQQRVVFALILFALELLAIGYFAVRYVREPDHRTARELYNAETKNR